MEVILWNVLPYIAVTVMVVGTIGRYWQAESGWTTKSSQFLEQRQLKFAGPIFHLGLFAVLGGHVGGVLVPKALTEMAGVSEDMYHMGAVFVGLPAGGLLTGAFLWLIWRRFRNARVRLGNTSTSDRWLCALLLLAIGSGLLATLTNAGHSTFNYRDTVSPWFRSLLLLQPQGELMQPVPFFFQLHMVSWMLVAAAFPFTRLVHCLSVPFAYLFRPPIIYRKKA